MARLFRRRSRIELPARALRIVVNDLSIGYDAMYSGVICPLNIKDVPERRTNRSVRSWVLIQHLLIDSGYRKSFVHEMFLSCSPHDHHIAKIQRYGASETIAYQLIP